MQFDDRLATVLRQGAGSESGVRTQFRQLLDLLGSAPAEQPSPLSEPAYQRLGELADTIAPEDQSRILREPGLRLRNPQLVAWLAGRDAKPAAAALATARLTETQWLDLIPRLDVVSRGFLRHRRDLPAAARQVLERLGVNDLGLPRPADETGTVVAADLAAERTDANAIGAIRRRIEAFRSSRATGKRESRTEEAGDRLAEIDFRTEPLGVINHADSDGLSVPPGPLLVGMRLTDGDDPEALATLDPAGARALHHRQPLRAARLTIRAAPAISGEWCVDAAPLFDTPTGAFRGYAGRMRRAERTASTAEGDSAAERMRQVLHELRTPVNAIQGFAEIIQQQLFGPAPNAYRALAAAVAVDSARLLAAFDEVERLTRAESGALELEEGECDWRAVTLDTLKRLDGVLRPRNAGFDLSVSGQSFAVGLERAEALTLAWRILATLTGSLAPGETVALDLAAEEEFVSLVARLPAGLASVPDPFRQTGPSQAGAVSAGMFGTGFALRLAREEARLAGGSLAVREGSLALVLPALTGTGPAHSNGEDGRGGEATA